MRVYNRTLVLIAALIIAVSVQGKIIELPENYSRTSPWTELIELGVVKYTETDCVRTCVAGELPRVCLFTFTLEFYAAMGTACGNCSDGVLEDCYRPQCIPADGIQRGLMSINRQLPGAPINVCKNDLIVVNVKNQMAGEEVTIHWHGFRQKHSQWMDGVPYVTQCPFGGESFRYIFPAEEAGTYFYHSHSGTQRTNGIYGALVVHAIKSEEPWSEDLYDYDYVNHTIVFSDWMHENAEMFLPGLPSRQPGVRPTTILLNGFGRYYDAGTDSDPVNVSFPLATFHVQKDLRYRFRIINANNHVCPVILQIQNHSLTLIATDGMPIEPRTVDSIVHYPGERFDFVPVPSVNVTAQDAFWIHVRALGTCAADEIYQYGVLSYGTSGDELGILPTRSRPTITNPLPTGIVLNEPNTTCGQDASRLCITDLISIGYDDADEVKRILMTKPDVRLFIPFGFHQFDVDTFHEDEIYHSFMNLGGGGIQSAWMNNISFNFPDSPILSSYNSSRSQNSYCNQDNLPAKCLGNDDNATSTPYCECTQVIVLPENGIIQLILIDNAEIAGLNHPIHLHGFSFYVVHMQQNLTRHQMYTVSEAKEYVSVWELENSDKASSTNNTMPPLKDTISVPSGGMAIVQFKADNPGSWLMHCHFEWHMAVGMTMVFRVEGTIPSAPPGFPKCGNFDPLEERTTAVVHPNKYVIDQPKIRSSTAPNFDKVSSVEAKKKPHGQ
ncbi:laccase-1-like [Diprion similis]|uniref:laccase-1-like n=1 Tax=Diprion similis TaxID=362088 RepID=UPI001EF90327|nr:laccase-1-like [Diprion similis]